MVTTAEHGAAAGDRVPWQQLIAFGLGGLIPIALFNVVLQLVPLLGNISLGIGAVWLGAILVLPRLWEAFSDPVVGHLSDHARTRWGRRRPFILLGGIAVAFSFVAIWWVPREEFLRQYVAGDAAVTALQLAFLLGTLLLFFTACAVFEIPHGALGLEMSADTHERTRLFSAKSFLGNIFAMGTPWLIFLASLEAFGGPAGNLADGMRHVSLLVAAVLAPLAIWWFFALREPAFAHAGERKKSSLRADMRATVTNRTFLLLTAIVFTLAMGFNFVGSFANYITIFYLYGGDVRAASPLLGIAGTIWAVTALVAVVPLNWLGRRLGKRSTLLVAIGLMCAAQLAKILCYRPDPVTFGLAGRSLTFPGPYLILIPTVLLSAGMVMFFTLGASMVGDVCDEDELRTGARAEGTYLAVSGWFIKTGTAFASLVMGALLLYTGFDERQNTLVDALGGDLATIAAGETVPAAAILDHAAKLRAHLESRPAADPAQAEHTRMLLDHLTAIERLAGDTAQPATGELLRHAAFLRRQSPATLFRLRLVEIGLPLVLSLVSLLLVLRYPLTEERCREIEMRLRQRRAEPRAA